ncbi:MAG TPA: peptide-methionine (S)-S-oxide reductase MsrA [Sphingobacterium bovisgrunnientis]|uniref:peptide-methionine (S)-S-oxide reductase MsrA n=1 Tax=Sphingobacterium bovisgrunnientis TaxID=1874697 RepID=UPI001F042B7E|nr:peptide-methionine (S)-S-oxide reductase MsrA [Sphingobacterium bovisgrunnientis]HLS39050.1 peptide-methionine (S)-S-oxide reductase MsrA [Sphingobacterium bovisgrunnientis]
MHKEYVKVERSQMENREVAILAGGCFWCVEAPLLLLEGVDTVVSGYIGGHTENPTYAQISTGNTGHAEAVKVTYDTTKITFDELLEVFFTMHDPTQLNRQGNDVGTQYRSAIFPVNKVQDEKSRYYIEELNKSGAFERPIVTTIEFADIFYQAEDYHQNYYNNNPNEMYCQLVARPKVEKVKKVFANKLKKK